MHTLPSHIIKKDGHTVRFSEKKLGASLARAARHVGFSDDAALASLTREILLRIAQLERDTITVQKVREIISGVLREKGLANLRDGYDLTFLHIHALRVQKVLKRSGAYDEFRPYNIFKSLVKSFRDAGTDDPQKSAELTKEIVERIESSFAHRGTPSSSDVKKAVEQSLLRHGLKKAYDAYRLHRYL